MVEKAKQLPKSKKKALTPKQLNNFNQVLGFEGELVVERYLFAHGYTILDRNIRTKQLEIDLLSFDTQTQQLVIVEVKTRSNRATGTGWEAVGWRKMTAVETWLDSHYQDFQLQFGCRFDIITVRAQQVVQHFKNVSW